MTFSKFLPRSLQDNYRSLMSGNLVKNKVLDEKNLQQLQDILNNSQAQDQDQSLIQKTVQFLYRQNTFSFYKFLVKNKLEHVVLWTESKCIVRHLGLQGMVYIRWNKDERIYEVSLHKNILNGKTREHGAVKSIVSKVQKSQKSEIRANTQESVTVSQEQKVPETSADSKSSWVNVVEKSESAPSSPVTKKDEESEK